MIKTIKEACMPRKDVLNNTYVELVLDVEHLFQDERINPKEFFETTYATSGMNQMLRAVFSRLEGRGDQPVLLLAQSMGGGKTHNLIAAGLLAKYPSLRKSYAAEIHISNDLGPVAIAGFSGRNNEPFWDEIATHLNQPNFFKQDGRIKVPGKNDWVKLLGQREVLILLDEFPPYLERLAKSGMRAQLDFSLSDVVNALTNLCIAASECRKTCVIVTDLDGHNWDTGGAALQGVLDNAAKTASQAGTEINKLALRIAPIKLDSDEFYHILTRRLFESVASTAEVKDVAQAHQVTLDQAVKAGILVEREPGLLASQIEQSYPFHPEWRNLYSRIKENTNFQQTRGLLRLIRAQLRTIWQNPEINPFLLGPQHLLVTDQEIHSQLDLINNTLTKALVTDVGATSAPYAFAQQIDKDESSGYITQQIATLIFFSSMSNAGDRTGLTQTEILRTMVTPALDTAATLKLLTEKLAYEAEYLHFTKADQSYHFTKIENPIASVKKAALSLSSASVNTKVKHYLENVFAPKRRTAYQKVLAYPDPNDVQPSVSETILVIEGGKPGLDEEFQKLYATSHFKNRLLFLTNSNDFGKLDSTARRYFGAENRLLDAEKTNDTQKEHYKEIFQDALVAFRSSVISTFNELSFPKAGGSLHSVALSPKLTNNQLDGENMVLDALVSSKKFVDNINDKTLSAKIEMAFPRDRCRWASVKEQAAIRTEMPLTPPDLLDRIKDDKVAKGHWRWHPDTAEVEKGDLVDKTSVTVALKSRDPLTGKMLLDVSPRHGDVVYYAEDTEVTTNSRRLNGDTLESTAMVVNFLCVDSKGKHVTGDVIQHKNKLTVGCTVHDNLLHLAAIPSGDIIYSFEHTSLDVVHQKYTAPVTMPEGQSFVWVQVVTASVKGEPEKRLFEHKSGPVVVDVPLKFTNKQTAFDAISAFKATGGTASFKAKLTVGDKTLRIESIGEWTGADIEKTLTTVIQAEPTTELSLDILGATWQTSASCAKFSDMTNTHIEEENIQHGKY